jgi:hypothetical protein
MLADMIESRWKIPPKQDAPEVAELKYVCLVFHLRFMEDSAWKRIRKFEEKAGCKIRVVENSVKMSV